MANLVISAVSTFNDKGLKKGKKEISAFEKNIKSLGKTFGVVFAASTLVNFSKKAVDAFAADQAAAKALETQLKNVGLGFADASVETYIANLQDATGVLDDHLRPALQSLITATGSLTQSQRALGIAIDISAATGKSLEEVSAAIAKGFTGQTTALGRLGAGIKKTTLATGDMNKILDEASSKFSGQNAARLTTYAGKMDLLAKSSRNAEEIIGKGLVDALSMLGKDQNISAFGSGMEQLATQIANIVVGLGAILGKIVSIGSAIFSKLHLDKVMSFVYNNSLLGKLSQFGASKTKTAAPNVGGYGGIPSIKERIAIVETNKARKEELKLLATKNGIENKNLEELKKKFDLERIGLNAALNNATDEETKLRLKSQLAILDGNEALAAKLLAEMNAAEALKKLAEQAAAAGKSITEFAFTQVKILINKINDQIALINDMFGTPSKSTAGTSSAAPSFPAISTDFYSGQQNIVNPLAGTYYGETGRDPMPTNVTINVDATSMVDPANMTRVVQQAFLEINRNGYSTVPAGQGF